MFVSVLRDADLINGRLPVTLYTGFQNTHLVAIYTQIDMSVKEKDLMGQVCPSEVASVKVTVYATEEKLRTGGGQLETENGRCPVILRDKSLKCGRGVKCGYGLESHAHQAIRKEPAFLKAGIVSCGSECLRICLI